MWAKFGENLRGHGELFDANLDDLSWNNQPSVCIAMLPTRDGLRCVALPNYATLRFDFIQNYARELRYVIFIDYGITVF